MQQMFKAIRETMPYDVVVDGGSSESMFTGMLYGHLADLATSHQRNGPGDTLHLQLASRPDIDATTLAPDNDGTTE